ncbi:hypothetical protein [Nitrosospira sp. Nsp1]|uniref:hypothetical protein n=1 Tax=Nitrosospira sp. Nsp1 TaxID=136547 RepID=UPI00087F22E4|nr:hypothetical protein [Nitrosospira sp. Nsp1]SCX57590.1 hypothetical protein SAMN05720354_1206 [Nitrosospira sp. Nsp1]
MKSFLVGLCALMLAGCASTPPLVYKYYPAKATAQVTVTQTIDCDADKRLIILNTPSVASVYSSDRRAPLFEFDASKLGGGFTDNDFTFAWYDDGRIKSLNSQVTGQGEAIVKAATVILSVAVGAGPPDDSAAAACKVVASRGGKPVTIVYESAVDDLTKRMKPSRLNVSENYGDIHNVLGKVVKLPLFEVEVEIAATDNPVLVEQSANGSSKHTVPLKLAKTALATVTVTKNKIAISKSIVVVPTAHTYELPVPRGAFFGKATFSVQLNEAGVLTQVSYGKTSGFAATLNSASTLDAALSPSDAAKANALKSQADVMAQTARLANCQAKPSECK